ncbi:SRPBCC domain-containing protein [Pseudoclavibacter sp. Z016]|uniref:SRPBCC family protein n=1 Tax=Pseudoclavibacter sp. Z016 TaxID=2080581 RepID=UPI000CE81DFD|nr:SRPBCC domain-containing protein [Pseudoclavibacter sp. Z016]PPF76963.1 polyketide cyclase [Pseudoclavibacter sp. Z016]
MPVISTQKDPDQRTLTVVTEHAATPERVWRLWEDPRQLERWWGPPTWPSTVDSFEFSPGGRVLSHMTGPDGTTAGEWWEFVSIEPHHALSFDNGFAHDDGSRNLELPVMRCTVTIEAAGDLTRMTTVSVFASPADFDSVIEMGMAEGMTEAMGQIDAVLAG